jgi:D-citramalate synthase
MRIEIMDTTLRDGEQMQGVSYSPFEKLHIARLLLKDLKVDRIEVASARVSKGEFEAIKQITSWPGTIISTGKWKCWGSLTVNYHLTG